VAGELTATGATISADGSLLAVRTYSDAYVWRLTRGDVAAAVLGRAARIALPRQQQGEGICVRSGRLLLSSEGRHAPVLAVPVPTGPAPVVTPSRSGTGSPTAGATHSASASAVASRAADSANSSSGRTTLPTSRWLFGFAAAGAAAALAAIWLVRRRSS
jgi:hypothetical protein